MKFILLCVLGLIVSTKGAGFITDQCKTPNDEDGECVNIQTCKSLMDISGRPFKTDWDKFIIRAHGDACQHTENKDGVCCPISEIMKPQTTTMKPETTTMKIYVPTNQEGCTVDRCVSIYNCSVLLQIAMNPNITVEDRQYLRDRQCKNNADKFSVCCPEPELPDNTAEVQEHLECVAPKGAPGICMAPEDCIPISIIHRKERQTQEDIKFLLDSACPTQDELYCCPTVVSTETEAPTTTTTAAPIVETCETPNGANGTCISVIHCEPLMRILQKTDFFANDAQYLNASFCGDAANFPKVCCPETSAVEEFSLPQPPYCGTVSTAQAEFDSGSITYKEEYPWTAMLLYKNKRKEKSHIYCGGTLIHERFVLTAAHCLQEPEWNLTGVRLGVWATKAMEYCQNQETSDQLDCESKHIDMVVSKIIKHPEHESLYNDLALLQLNAAVRVTRYITPICLPLETRQFSASFDNTAMQISGWGAHMFGEIAEVKMKSITYISNMDECKKLYSNGVAGDLTAKHVCVKGKGTDDGKVLDSGGALMAVVNVGRMQSYFLVGVEAISYEVPLEKGYPFIFTRVSPYLDWIKSEIIEKDRDLLPTTEECGKYDAITNRIIGGAQTGIEEYPWTALLLCANEKGDIAINCGGSLINKYYVITAAHCTKENEYELFKVRLGDWHITEDKDCDGHLCGPPERTIEISINNILRHPRYNPRNLDYDVALLRLKDRVEYTRFIKPICLPMDVSLRGKRYDGNSATIVGWGLTEMNQLSDIKLKATVQIIYGNNGKKFRVRDSKIYATGNGNDSCRGDSGGPLMIKEEVNENKNWYLIGIISYGNLNNTCGTEESIGIYARVSSFLDWINDTIRT